MHRKDTKDLWNTQIADIREDIGYCLLWKDISRYFLCLDFGVVAFLLKITCAMQLSNVCT